MLATFERADCALSSSSLIGSFRMSSLNCGSVSLKFVSVSLIIMLGVIYRYLTIVEHLNPYARFPDLLLGVC